MPSPRVEDFLPLAKRLASRLSWLPHDQDDLIQEGLLELHQAFRKSKKITIRDPEGFAIVVLSRAMKNYYSRDCSQHQHLADLKPLPFHLSESSPLDPTDHLFLKEYFRYIEDRLGLESRVIAENLVSPGEEFRAFILGEVERKTKEVRRGKDRRGILTIRVSQRQLQEALGLSIHRWTSILKKIQEETRRFLEEKV